MSVKVYTVSLENEKFTQGFLHHKKNNKPENEPCFIKADVVLKSDYDKLEARCKELEEKIRVFTLSPATISSDLQRAFEKEHSKAEILKKENRILKAKLEVAANVLKDLSLPCTRQDYEMWQLDQIVTKAASDALKELDSIGE